MLKIYNTLTKKEETFKPIKKGEVKMYSCGPTVYNYSHIGNFRTAIFNDVLKRTLIHLGYKVNHVMNITDVDDKTINGSKNSGVPLKEFTRKYEKIYLDELSSLNTISPNKIIRATDSIQEMIEIIQTLIKKKYAYKTEDGIYFSIEKSKHYGKLINLQKSAKTKERIKSDEYDKENPHDFALWKFHTEEDGDVVWQAPFGKGRPGWHIECSAMSMKHLGKTLDIHIGGTDLMFPHHTNEIAQSEAYSGKKFVNYWMHAGFLTFKEGKMSKSIGNVYYLKDLLAQGFQAEHFRYFCLQTHYRSPLPFSIENLEAAKNSYERIKNKIIELKKVSHKGNPGLEYKKEFEDSLNEDINIPKALQIFIKTLDDSTLDTKKKLSLLKEFDSVLGLGIQDFKEEKIKVDSDLQALINIREELRKQKKWLEADQIRNRVKDAGYEILDTPEGPKLKKI